MKYISPRISSGGGYDLPIDVVKFNAARTFNPGETLIDVQGPCEIIGFNSYAHFEQINLDIKVDDVLYKMRSGGSKNNVTIPYSLQPYRSSDNNAFFIALDRFFDFEYKTLTIGSSGGATALGIWKSSEFGNMTFSKETLLPRIKAKKSIIIKLSDELTGPVAFDSQQYILIQKFKE